jgi:hypothetical protein
VNVPCLREAGPSPSIVLSNPLGALGAFRLQATRLNGRAIPLCFAAACILNGRSPPFALFHIPSWPRWQEAPRRTASRIGKVNGQRFSPGGALSAQSSAIKPSTEIRLPLIAGLREAGFPTLLALPPSHSFEMTGDAPTVPAGNGITRHKHKPLPQKKTPPQKRRPSREWAASLQTSGF